jgi:hypothetical protein
MFERVAITEPAEWRAEWDSDLESYVRKVPRGELDDRLVHWGYVSEEEMNQSMARIRGSAKHRVRLSKYLRDIEAEFGKLL